MSKRSIAVVYGRETGSKRSAQNQFFNGAASVPHIESSATGARGASKRTSSRPSGAAATSATGVSPPTTPDQEGLGSSAAFPESPSGVEEQANNSMTPKAGRWTKREDDLLRSAVDEYGAEDWKHIAAVVFEHARSEAQCALRWAKVLSVGLKKGQWTEDEDAAVREQVELAGGALNVKWNAVADALPGRLGKQVRERWQNHLDPALSKEPWEEAEDQLLVSLQAVMGNKWSEIARAFGGRSENSVKNRWNSKQRRSLAAERKRRTGSELGIMPAPDHATLAAKVAAISGSSSSRTTSSSSRGGNPSSSSSRSIESRESFASEGKDGEGKGSWEPRNDDDDDDSCIKIDFSKALQAANSPTVATAAASSSLTQPPASASHRRQSHQSLLPPPVASTPASSSSSGAGSSSSRASGYRAAGFAAGLRAAAADQKDEKDARRRRPLPLSPSPPGKISSSSSGSSSSDYPAEARQRWASSGADPLAALCATAEAHESMGSSEPWRHFSAFAAAAGAVAPLEVNQPPMASSLPPPPPFHTQHHTLARATSDDEVREAGAALLEIMGME